MNSTANVSRNLTEKLNVPVLFVMTKKSILPFVAMMGRPMQVNAI